MTNTIILDNFLPGTLAEQCLNAISDHHKTNPDLWSRYDNPWEHKTILTKKLPSVMTNDDRFGFSPPLSTTFDIREAVIATCLERMRLHCHPLCRALQPSTSDMGFHQWVPDLTYHYDGVFIYQPGDYLSMHLDAGINPVNGMRKHATALLYLTTSHAPLVLSAKEPKPVWKYGLADTNDTIIDPVANRLVCFINDDNAWHGAPGGVWANEERVLLTVSFLSNPQAEIPGGVFTNKRTRAYFADTGDPDTDALRDQRSQDNHGLYRLENK